MLNPRIPTRSLTQSLIIMVCMLFIAVTTGFSAQRHNSLTSDPIVVILSSESKPFQAAAHSCVTSLKSSGHTTRIKLLSSLSEQDLASMQGTVVAIGARAAQSALKDLPESTKLYYCMVTSPDLIGLTDRPNTAGISSDANPIEEARLINQASTSFRTIGLFYDSSSASSRSRIKRVQDSLTGSLRLEIVDINAHNSVSDAIKELLSRDIDLVWTIPDPAVYKPAMVKSLLIESLKKRIPVYGFSHSIVRAGSTFGIGIEPITQGARLSTLINSNATDQHLSPRLSVAINTVVASRIDFKFNDRFLDNVEKTFGSD